MKKECLSLSMTWALALHAAPEQLRLLTPKPAVIVVDVQADFMELPLTLSSEEMKTRRYIRAPLGALAVVGTGVDYLAAINAATTAFRDSNIPIIFTQDWHPEGHISFASRWQKKGGEMFKPFAIKGQPGIKDREQMLWPDHCVQGTPGAEILAKQESGDMVIQKGTDRNNDSYSGFKDDSGVETRMRTTLERMGITDLIVYGIATDYCVKATALHGRDAGYKVHLILNLSRGVDMATTVAALKRMHEQDVKIYFIQGLHDGMPQALRDAVKKAGIPVREFQSVQAFIEQLKTSMQRRFSEGVNKTVRKAGKELGKGMERAGRWLQSQSQ